MCQHHNVVGHYHVNNIPHKTCSSIYHICIEHLLHFRSCGKQMEFIFTEKSCSVSNCDCILCQKGKVQMLYNIFQGIFCAICSKWRESGKKKKAIDFWGEQRRFNIVLENGKTIGWEKDKQSKIVRLLRIYLVLITIHLQLDQFIAGFLAPIEPAVQFQSISFNVLCRMSDPTENFKMSEFSNLIARWWWEGRWMEVVLCTNDCVNCFKLFFITQSSSILFILLHQCYLGNNQDSGELSNLLRSQVTTSAIPRGRNSIILAHVLITCCFLSLYHLSTTGMVYIILQNKILKCFAQKETRTLILQNAP